MTFKSIRQKNTHKLYWLISLYGPQWERLLTY